MLLEVSNYFKFFSLLSVEMPMNSTGLLFKCHRNKVSRYRGQFIPNLIDKKDRIGYMLEAAMLRLLIMLRFRWQTMLNRNDIH